MAPYFSDSGQSDAAAASHAPSGWLRRKWETAKALARVVAGPLVWLWEKVTKRREITPVTAALGTRELGIPAGEIGSGGPPPPGQIRQRLCKQVYAPPYKARLKGFCFVLQGDAAAIQSSVIQPALANDFKPASLVEDLFAVAWIHYDEFGSAMAPDNTHGMHCYKESAVINLVQDATAAHEEVYVYVPSLYVDSSAAMSSGYTFGFPKAFGEITMSDIAPNSGGVKLATNANEVKQFQTPNMFSERLRVYEAIPGAGQKLAHIAHLRNLSPEKIEEFAQEVDAALTALAATKGAGFFQSMKKFVDAMVFWRAPLLLLKQLPSATTPLGKPAYQAYVTVKAEVTAVHEVALLGAYSVTFQDWDSSRFVRAYGLANPPTEREASKPLEPLLGFYVDVSAELSVDSERPI